MALPPGPSACPPPVPVLAPAGCPNCGGGGGGGGGCIPPTQQILCDQHPLPDAGDGLLVRFLRTYTHSCATGAITGSVDTELDGITPYTVLGTVGNCCEDVVPVVIVPRSISLAGITGPTVVGNAPVVAITVRVRNVGAAGSVTITTGLDVLAAVTGDVFEWTVIRDNDSFVGSIQIDTTDAADDVLVTYSEAV